MFSKNLRSSERSREGWRRSYVTEKGSWLAQGLRSGMGGIVLILKMYTMYFDRVFPLLQLLPDHPHLPTHTTLCSLNIVHLWVSVLVSIWSKEKLFYWGQSEALVCGYSIRSHFIFYFVLQNNSLRFSSTPMTYLVSGSWPLWQCQLCRYGSRLKKQALNQSESGWLLL